MHLVTATPPPDPPPTGQIPAELNPRGRAALPERRENRTEEMIWPPVETFYEKHKRFKVTCGFDRAGRVREIFADGYHTGSAMEALLDDVCILASIALQTGLDVEGLAGSVSRDGAIPVPRSDGTQAENPGPAASVVGAMLALAARVEAAEGPGIARAFDSGLLDDPRPRSERPPP